MSKPTYRLRIKETFCAAHQLRHYEGKCEHIHGHNFEVEVTVQGHKLASDTEMLIDFKVLRRYLKGIVADLDHTHLNDTPPFTAENPSSENLARYIYKKLDQCLQGEEAFVFAVEVAEKPGQSATYIEL